MNKRLRQALTFSASALMLLGVGASAGVTNINASSTPTSIYRMSHHSHPHLIYKDPRTTAGDKYSVNYKGYKYIVNQLGIVISRKPLRYRKRVHKVYHHAKRHYQRHAVKRNRRRARKHVARRHVKRNTRRSVHKNYLPKQYFGKWYARKPIISNDMNEPARANISKHGDYINADLSQGYMKFKRDRHGVYQSNLSSVKLAHHNKMLIVTGVDQMGEGSEWHLHRIK